MAYLNFSVLHALGPLRFAKTGYGKRIPAGEPGPGSAPPTAFQHLGKRERYLAFLIDALPVGAAMDVKTLAKLNAPYGPQAVRKALGLLVEAGHLYREQTRVKGQWVSVTYWTSEQRTPDWWARALAAEDEGDDASGGEGEGGSVGAESASPEEDEEYPVGLARVAESVSGEREESSDAYRLLVELGFGEPRLALSAKDCRRLEALVEEWFRRGATPERVIRDLAADLPVPLYRAAGLVKYRLENLMPPLLHRRKPVKPQWEDGDRMVECGACGRPGRPDKLPGGLCKACKTLAQEPEKPDKGAGKGLPADEVHGWVGKLRDAVRIRECGGPGLAGT